MRYSRDSKRYSITSKRYFWVSKRLSRARMRYSRDSKKYSITSKRYFWVSKILSRASMRYSRDSKRYSTAVRGTFEPAKGYLEPVWGTPKTARGILQQPQQIFHICDTVFIYQCYSIPQMFIPCTLGGLFYKSLRPEELYRRAEASRKQLEVWISWLSVTFLLQCPRWASWSRTCRNFAGSCRSACNRAHLRISDTSLLNVASTN